MKNSLTLASPKEILNELVKIANEAFVEIKWLAPGTYHAEDIFMLYSKNGHSGCFDSDEIREIQCGNMTARVPINKIFETIKKGQKIAKVRGHKKPRWTVSPEGEAVASTVIEFPDKSNMKELHKLLKSNKKDAYKQVNLNIYDGIVAARMDTGIRKCNLDSGIIALAGKTKNDGRLPFYVFRIPTTQIKHLYGECRVNLYFDAATEKHGVFITNEDGWSIWSDSKVSAEEVIRMYEKLTEDLYEPDEVLEQSLQIAQDMTE